MQQYSEGQQLQGSDGNIYVVSGGVPRLAPGRATASAQPAPTTIYGNPKQPPPQTPDEAAADSLTVDQKNYDVTSKPVYDRSNAIDKVRDGYRQDKRVLKYEQAIPVYISGLQSEGNPAGDLLLVNAFSKVNDPDTGVQQREGDQAASAQPATEQIKAQLLKQFGDDGYGNFTPEGRKRMREAMTVRMRQLADQYRQTRAEHVQYIKSLGLPNTDPETIIGPFAGLPFQKAEEAYQGRGLMLGGKQVTPGPQGAQGDDQVTAELERRIAGGADPSETIQWLISIGRQPDKATIDAIIANYGNKRPDVRPPEEEASPLVNSFMNGVGDVVEGVGDIPGILANPMTAGINWATGSNFNPDLGQNLRDSLGLPDNGNPMASAVNEAASSALGGAGLARTIANGARGVTQSVANTVAEQPIRQGFAGAGAGAGGEYGREMGLGPAGQAGLALLGGTGGYVAANSAFRAANPAMNPVMEAATAQNVRLRPADVGGATTRRMDSAAGQSAFSASSISNAAKNTQDDLNSALNRNARSQGNVLPEDEAGEALRTPLKDYSQKQANRIGLVYDRAEERAKGVKIKPLQAVNFLDQQIARFSQAPMGETLVKEFQAVRDKIANGVSVSGMRDARTILSQGVYDGKLRSGVEKGVYKQFLGLLSQDIEAGLTAAGRKDALNLFRVADKAWSERIDYIDDVLQPVIGGNKSGEDILRAVEGMTQGKAGGVRRLNELLRELPPEQSGNIRATIIDRMGRATAGQQDDTGQAFSANTFLTNWNRMSSKGKAMMFGDGELRKNLDQIAKVASATKDTSKFANASNTSGSLQNNVIAMGSASGVAELATGHGMATLAALTSAQLLTGKLLSSQAFTRWLARFPSNPQAQPSYSKQLAQIAAREPIIANDIASVQNFLGGQSYRAAASSEDQ